MQEVIVLTSTELGWDCVIGVYPTTIENVEKLEKYCEIDTNLVVHYKQMKDFDLDQ